MKKIHYYSELFTSLLGHGWILGQAATAFRDHVAHLARGDAGALHWHRVRAPRLDRTPS